MDTTETLLKELTEAHGVSGYEAEVRAVMRRHLEPLGVLEQDKIGSLICRQAGTSEAPRVMLAAHMDEIGFMIKQVTKEGFLRFVPLGGWFDQVLLGQRVVIRTTKGDVELANPDVAIILESDIGGDVPGIGEEESAVKLGRGPTMVLFDARMIPHLRLRDLVMETAREAGVPLQTSFLEGGATDGAPIHLHNSGVPTVVLGVAARHIHSHSSIIHRDDFDHQVALVAALVRKLDATTVANLAA